MTMIGKWDVAVLEVRTNGFYWAVVKHPSGKEKVFRVSPAVDRSIMQGEQGVTELWRAGIGIDYVQDRDGKDTETLISYLVAHEAQIQAAMTGNHFQDVEVTFL
jgi:hypothetical protein